MRKVVTWISIGRAFWPAGTASAKALCGRMPGVVEEELGGQCG